MEHGPLDGAMLSSHVECKGTQEKALRTLSSSRSLAQQYAAKFLQSGMPVTAKSGSGIGG
jgi:hypothetical protein